MGTAEGAGVGLGPPLRRGPGSRSGARSGYVAARSAREPRRILRRRVEGILVPKRMLVKISGHLLSAADRIEVPARRTQGQISRAQGTLEQLLGDLPLKGEILRTYVSTRASAVRSPERLGQRAGRDTGGSRERVAPASTPVYGGPWDRRICRVATLRSARASRELRALKKLGLGQSEGRAEEEEPKTARPSGQYRGRVHRPRLSEQELQ